MGRGKGSVGLIRRFALNAAAIPILPPAPVSGGR